MGLPPAPVPSRPPVPDDAEAVVAVLRADEATANGVAYTTVPDVRGDWQRPSFDLARDGVVLELDGRVVGYAEHHAGRAWVAVHPDHHGRGLGGWLCAWSEQAARDHGQATVGQTIPEQAAPALDLVRGRGYTRRWDSWVFGIDLPAATAVPPGLPRPRPMRRPEEDRAVWEVIETAFSEWDARQPTTFEDWRAAELERDDVEVLVAEVDGRIVGAAVCIDEEAEDGASREGWVQQLAVDRAHRGRGLARALLAEAFTRFADRGCTTAGLSTDSRTGAKALYEHVGMRVTESLGRWGLDL